MLFADLPTQRSTVARPEPPRSGGGWRDAAMGLLPLLALVLFFTTGRWWWFLLIPAGAVIVRATDGGGRGR
ncbi:MAG TPA: hypothetical protein VFJ94_00520 [Intrasporangium sp.]|nr:hypothetical protein [Intrasporangium sp.]